VRFAFAGKMHQTSCGSPPDVGAGEAVNPPESTSFSFFQSA